MLTVISFAEISAHSLSKDLDARGVNGKRQLRVLLTPSGIMECGAVHHRVWPFPGQQSLDRGSIRQIRELARHGKDIFAAPHEHPDNIRAELTGGPED